MSDHPENGSLTQGSQCNVDRLSICHSCPMPTMPMNSQHITMHGNHERLAHHSWRGLLDAEGLPVKSAFWIVHVIAGFGIVAKPRLCEATLQVGKSSLLQAPISLCQLPVTKAYDIQTRLGLHCSPGWRMALHMDRLCHKHQESGQKNFHFCCQLVA